MIEDKSQGNYSFLHDSQSDSPTEWRPVSGFEGLYDISNDMLTLGSLFSGSGGFELGGKLAGIEPKWNSEIEPFPILVTHKRLPEVKHYGDVSKLRGSDLEPVDIVTFGSPCQDLSKIGRAHV